MADEAKPKEEKPPFLSNDLKVMMEGTERKVYIKDRHNKEHLLNPLNISDMIEFETNLGISIMEISRAELKLRHIMFLLYLSLRKENCAQEDLERKKYAYTERQVGDMFDLGLLRNSVTVLTDLLHLSGFRIENPPMPTSPKDTTLVNEPEKASTGTA